jgi:hypothetical protein
MKIIKKIAAVRTALVVCELRTVAARLSFLNEILFGTEEAEWLHGFLLENVEEVREVTKGPWGLLAPEIVVGKHISDLLQ